MALAAVGLNTAIWNNNLRSLALLALYPVMIGGMLWLIAAVAGIAMTGTGDTAAAIAAGNNFLAAWWPTILAVVGIWFLIAAFFHGHMIRALAHAKPVARADEPELYNLLENLCIARGLKMPALQIVETDALNAFASGIGENSYTITVTRGLMETLAPDEMEAVLGHELTHIINRDVRLLIVSVIFTGMIGFAAQMVWSLLRHSMYASGRSRSRDRRSDPRLLLAMLAIAAILWIGYCATLFTRFALSRRREFMADAGAVELTKNPEAMMRALQKIAGRDRMPDTPADVALMCIENEMPFLGLFATHPPIGQRIETIAALTGTPVPQPVEKPKNPWA